VSVRLRKWSSGVTPDSKSERLIMPTYSVGVTGGV
jgi:hypothetical protein